MRPKSLSNSVRAAILSIASAALAFAPLRLPAQAAQKSPNGLPDIVGLYPGMPVGDAYNLLKAYFPARGGKVDVHQDTIQGLNGGKPLATQLHIPPKEQQDTYDDAIDVFITLPPNKQAVWAISRNITFEPSKSPSVEALVAGLRQKYGPEIHMPYETRAFPPDLRWIFDRQGKRVPDDFARKCNQLSSPGPDSIPRGLVSNPSKLALGNLVDAPAGVPGAENCKTFVYLLADVGGAVGTGGGGHVMLGMYDLGMALNAGLRTEAVIRGVANAEQQQAQQQQKKIDKKAVPSF